MIIKLITDGLAKKAMQSIPEKAYALLNDKLIPVTKPTNEVNIRYSWFKLCDKKNRSFDLKEFIRMLPYA
jgi:hypothetical protein